MQWKSALEQAACSQRGQFACEVCQRGCGSQEGLKGLCPMLIQGFFLGATQ